MFKSQQLFDENLKLKMLTIGVQRLWNWPLVVFHNLITAPTKVYKYFCDFWLTELVIWRGEIWCSAQLNCNFQQNGILFLNNNLVRSYFENTVGIKFGGDLKSNNLKSGTIWNPDFLKVVFQMVQFSNGWALAMAIAIVPTVVYFDQFSGACSTWKRVKLLF